LTENNPAKKRKKFKKMYQQIEELMQQKNLSDKQKKIVKETYIYIKKKPKTEQEMSVFIDNIVNYYS
jgi:ABC-type phosphate transport system substrate-binding protein